MADSFSGVIAFAFMGSMILVGTVLRARISWLQFALIPASLLGGLIGFLLISSGYAFGYSSEEFVPFAFHFFTLSFMSLVLTGKEPSADNKSIQAGGIWLAIGWTMHSGDPWIHPGPGAGDGDRIHLGIRIRS